MRYTAKRLGWNEKPEDTVTQNDILDPYDFPSDDLEGELVMRQIANVSGITPYTQYLVGGQPADPLTLKQVQ